MLDRAATLVRPGGSIVYITCSLLPEENDAAIERFMQRTPASFAAERADVVLADLPILSTKIRRTARGLQMSPALTGTDGFYVSVLKHSG